MINKNTGTIQPNTTIEGEGHNSEYHANRKIKTKYIGKRNAQIKFKASGEAYYIKNGNQWYFQPKGSDETYRVQAHHLSLNIEEGFYAYAIYNGMNPAFKGRKGEVHVSKDYDWIFRVKEGEGTEPVRVQFESLEFLFDETYLRQKEEALKEREAEKKNGDKF